MSTTGSVIPIDVLTTKLALSSERGRGERPDSLTRTPHVAPYVRRIMMTKDSRAIELRRVRARPYKSFVERARRVARRFRAPLALHAAHREGNRREPPSSREH